MKPYFGNMIDDLRVSGECNYHLTMKFNLMGSKNNGESQHMQSKSDNIEIMIDNNTNKFIDKLFS